MSDNLLKVDVIPFEKLEKHCTDFCHGFDFVDSTEFCTIPGIINSETAKLRKLEKPFTMVIENSDSPTTVNYYKDLRNLVRSFVTNIHELDLKYNMYMILHGYYSKISLDMIRIFKKYKIKYEPSDIDNIIKRMMYNTTDNSMAVKSILDIFTLENIEQMVQLEAIKIKNIDPDKKDNSDSYDEFMHLLKTAIAPYAQTICLEVLYNMYNFVIEEMYTYTLRATMNTGKEFNLEGIEDELLETFVDIHDDFRKKLWNLIGNLVMIRTPQHLVPEAAIRIQYDE